MAYKKRFQSLFNIASETGQVGNFNTTLSPADTEWALGSISDGVSTLTFDRFVRTLNNDVGDNILNGPMVLHLITDDIYIDVTFTSWSAGGTGGGFSYTRSTDQTLSVNELESGKKIDIFPNPSSEFIQITNLKSKKSYSIYNTLSAEIKSGVISNNEQIDIRSFTNGLYILIFDNENTIKFIKQ
ncbi:T9SS type A sorting domain-containing protein [Seonamhaeicola algicola]|uniref:T9SS type A sorting domain-containing protein n=1 Tax=Seonamhaeicola algicola TaxID=1719036 RepID=A0A5C7AYR4_9FLAO|nr:T9SS type A sorting domain-containing protein [Seonamhaeicola algicola]TXE13818.1 T9SS type A sorting domain-containing protein [Seonamhaeicola algicola]